MGEVWLAEQVEPRRRVAIKVIKAGMDTKEVVARFESERQALALMNHPAIAKVFDGGSTPEGRPYFVMEFVAGVPITEHCDTHRLSTTSRLELFTEVCEGVQHAHQKAIIHRDLKPSNILVSLVDGTAQPKIIDFGIAKATGYRLTEKTLFTEVGSVIGTPEYMSPEQADSTGQDVDTRTDVYSLGVILYQLLTGELPFGSKELRSSGYEELRRKLREVEPPRPSTKLSTLGEGAADAAKNRDTDPGALRRRLEGDLDAVTMRALEKDRARRYGTPTELAADIWRHLRHEPVLARPPSQSYRLRKYVRRHRAGVAVASGLAVVLIGVAGTMTVQARRIARERDRANQETALAERVIDFMIGMFRVSDPSEARGNSISAREVLDRASQQVNAGLASDPKVRARLLSAMADVYQKLGLPREALAQAQQAVDIQQRLLGPDAPATLASRIRLSSVLDDLGRFAEAETISRATLEAARRSLGPEDKITLSAIGAQGKRLWSLTRYAEAEELLREALALRRKVLGDEDVATIDSGVSLATLLDEQGHHDEAAQLSEQYLAIERRVLPSDDPLVFLTRSNLASAYANRRRFDEADRVYRDLLVLAQRIYAPDHPYLLGLKNNIASNDVELGRFAEAEALYQEVSQGYLRTFGPEHPARGLIRYNLACLAARTGDPKKALGLLREILDHPFPPTVARAIADEPDLTSLHGDREFEALLARFEARVSKVQPLTTPGPKPAP
jgi:tetratricopeptide (TPR) repeat protein